MYKRRCVSCDALAVLKQTRLSKANGNQSGVGAFVADDSFLVARWIVVRRFVTTEAVKNKSSCLSLSEQFIRQ